MPEILLHYIWQQRLWAGFVQMTTDGKLVDIISVGQHNKNAGPDFINAHICIDGQEWIGNVEIHVHSSDWYKHRHHTDPAYDTTILHVVSQADKEVYNSIGKKLIQCELKYPLNKDYLSQMIDHAYLMDSSFGNIDCSHYLLADPTLLTAGWKKMLLQKRLECKRESIQELLTITQSSWVHAFYISLAHNFGFHINGLPFEALALATPLSYLQKHKNSLFQLTAILLGQAGILNDTHTNRSNNINNSGDKEALREEYDFLRKKFNLTPINSSMWKKARLRPQNMPEVRIRQFAHILYQSEFLFTKVINEYSTEKLVDLLTLKYFDDAVYKYVLRPMPLGKKSIEVLLINTIIPYQYTYAYAQQDYSKVHLALTHLEKIPKEVNSIVRQWEILGQRVTSAADTQALIHLYQHYCQPHSCYNCQVGNQVFAQKKLDLF